MSQSTASVPEPCGTCQADVKSSDKALLCDLCNKWQHTRCINITDEYYKLMKKLCSTQGKGNHWYCPGCDSVASQVLVSIKSLNDKHNKLETKHEELVSDVIEIKSEIEALKLSFAEVTKSEIEALKLSFAEVTKGPAKPHVSPITTTVTLDKHVKIELAEAMEREKRRSNLVIVGLQEGSENEERDRVKEILKQCVGEEVDFKIVGRIGKLVSGKSRLTRFSVVEDQMRKSILKGARNLKEKEEYRNVFIMPDLTKKQQENGKKLRDKLKEIRASGVSDAKIAHNEIVKMNGEHKEVLFVLED